VELKGARKRIRTILYAAPTREHIAEIASCNGGDRWQALYAVVVAERALNKALALFQSPVAGGTGRSPRGRTGALHTQAVAHAMALAWRQLTGRLPAKDNFRFHELVRAAIVSIFGHSVKKPNFESATKTAVDRIRRDEAGRS
jgi:hypothetical protein